MNQKIQTLILGIIYVLVALWLVIQLMDESYFSILVVSVPLVVLVLIAQRKLWLGLAVGALALSISLPFDLLDRFSIANVLIVLLAGITVMGDSIRKAARSVFDNWEGKCLFVVGAIVVARLVIDRPTSARLSDTGGVGEAAIYVLAFISFWVCSRIAAEPFNVRRNNYIIIFLACVGTLGWIIQLVLTEENLFWHGLFENPVWLLSALSLSFAFWKPKGSSRLPFSTLVLVLLVLALSSISTFRSRPMFAAGIILGVAFIHGRFVRMFVLVAVMSAMAIGLLVLINGGDLPDAVKRPLSTLVTADEADIQHLANETKSSPEAGWKSDFRATLYAIAWEQIQRHPLTGTGFSFGIDDLNVMMSFIHSDVSLQELYCTLTGGYHNSLLALVVLCGIPAGLIFLFASVSLSLRFFRQAAGVEDRHLLILSAATGGYFVARYGQMIINGEANEMFIVCSLLGIMNGLFHNEQFMMVKPRDETELRPVKD